MPWQSITLELARVEADALSEALLEAGAVSVAIEDAEAGTADERPRYVEPGWDAPVAWRRNRLQVLLGADADARHILSEAARAAGLARVPSTHHERVEDDDWVRRSEAQFAPLAIGERLWVVPSWHAVPREASGAVVRLDPGLAFGTGSHPTTRLVLAWLEAALAPAAQRAVRVLDYGCGSGILAIAAGKLGATAIDAVDIDARALVAARENAQANSIDLRVFAPDALPDGEYDIVLANILANPLIALAPLLASRTRRGGRIALAGLLGPQAGEVSAAYADAFEMRAGASADGWLLLEGLRR